MTAVGQRVVVMAFYKALSSAMTETMTSRMNVLAYVAQLDVAMGSYV